MPDLGQSGARPHGCARHVLEWIAWAEWLMCRTNGGKLDAPGRRWGSYPPGVGNPPYLARIREVRR